MSTLNGPSRGGDIGGGCHSGPPSVPKAAILGSAGLGGTPRLNFEAWTAFLRTSCGNQPDVIDPRAFTGWVRPMTVCGLDAAELKIECGSPPMDRGRDAYRSERTERDIRLVGADYYYAVFQVAGRSVMTQNDEALQLAVGDVALLDAARPAACSAGDVQWLRLQLPRRTLISHLGFEPQGGLHARAATSATRLLCDLVRDADKADGLAASAADSYMQLAIYDLIGALFAPSDPSPVSRHADKLFARIRGVVKDGFADPDFGPREVAVEAGSRCVTFKSSLPRAARPAANSFTRFAWITPRAFFIAARRWRQASLSPRSRTPAAFATTPISRGDFAIGLATRQAVAPKEKQGAPVRAKGRHGHTTSGLRRFRSCPQDRSRSSRRIKSSLRPADARARARTWAPSATKSGGCR